MFRYGSCLLINGFLGLKMKFSISIIVAFLAIGIATPRLSQSETAVGEKLKIARAMEKTKDWSGVVKTLAPLTDKLSNEDLRLLAKGYRQTGDKLNEIRVLELCVARKANDFQARVALGSAYSRANRAEDAMNAYREAQQVNAKYLPAYQGLLDELLKQKETYEARTILHDMVKIFGPRPAFNAELCRLYSAEGYLDKAIELCTFAIEKDKKAPENYIYLAQSLNDKLENTKATKILADALKRFPKSEPVLTAAGENQMLRKNYVGAQKYFRDAVKANRKSARAALGYAQASFELQKNQEALDAFTHACSLNRAYSKEFRQAIVRLRARKDISWQIRYESGAASCN